jgi:5-methyltetrahydrofolate--homocysteine methyltransferase
MKTVLSGRGAPAEIDREGPAVMIGERINPTGHKKMAQALKDRSFDYIRELALAQVEAGAAILDVNVGIPGADEPALLPEVLRLVSSWVEVPLCIDSNNPLALAAGLAAVEGKPLVNSVNGEEERLSSILPIVRDRGAAVIGLTMDDRGIPEDAETRLAIAERILERAAKLGIPAEDVLIDPLVLTVGANQQAGRVTLQTIERLRRELGVNINVGASNVSFGLPERTIINQAFLALCIGAGANCAITDPAKLASTVLACNLLQGHDAYGRRYIRHIRRLQETQRP